MKSKLIILVLLTFSFNAFSEVISTIKKNNLSIITNAPLIFDNGKDNLLYKGDYTFRYNFDSLQIDTTKKYNSSYLFNQNGQIVQKTCFNGDPYSCNVYYYTKDGKLDKSYYLVNTNHIEVFLDSLSSNIFYLKNNFTTLAKSSDVAQLTKYQYNDKGQLSKYIILDSDGNENVFEFQYDDKSRIIKVFKNKDLKSLYFYDQFDNIVIKEDAPQIITASGNCKYIEAEKYIYKNNELIQIDKICKSDKKVNIKIPSKNINQSVSLTPTLANSVMYANSNGTTISIIDAPKPQWEVLNSIIYENTLNSFHNWLTRRSFNMQKDKSKKLIGIEFQKFDSKEKIDERKNENLKQQTKERERLLEIQRIEKERKLKEAKEREQALEIERKENERKINEAKEQEEVLRKERLKTQELIEQIKRNHLEIMKLYFNTSSFSNNNNPSTINQISDTFKLNKLKRKKVIFDVYQTIYLDFTNSTAKERLDDMLLIQNNMTVLFDAKTKKIEKEIVTKLTIPEKSEYLKDCLSFIDK